MCRRIGYRSVADMLVIQFIGSAPELAEYIRTLSQYPDVITAEAHRHERDVRSDWRSISSVKVRITRLTSLVDCSRSQLNL